VGSRLFPRPNSHYACPPVATRLARPTAPSQPSSSPSPPPTLRPCASPQRGLHRVLSPVRLRCPPCARRRMHRQSPRSGCWPRRSGVWGGGFAVRRGALQLSLGLFCGSRTPAASFVDVGGTSWSGGGRGREVVVGGRGGGGNQWDRLQGGNFGGG
jgi:hypothetical protein